MKHKAIKQCLIAEVQRCFAHLEDFNDLDQCTTMLNELQVFCDIFFYDITKIELSIIND